MSCKILETNNCLLGAGTGQFQYIKSNPILVPNPGDLRFWVKEMTNGIFSHSRGKGCLYSLCWHLHECENQEMVNISGWLRKCTGGKQN
jgi:hypothetical protein